MIHPELDRALGFAAESPRLLVAVDFDGTLAEIVDHPEAARPLPGAMAALEALVALGTTVALVSGRRRSDLSVRAGPPEGVVLVGGHGAEWSDDDPGHADVAAVAEDAVAVIGEIDGAWVEAKPASVTVHLRHVAADKVDELLTAMERVAHRWGRKLEQGKAVAEIHLSDADKGTAIGRLRQRADARIVVYLGDDTTDEAAFRALTPGDVGVKVGAGPSSAEFRVPDPVGAVAVLERLAVLRRGISEPG